MSVAPCRLDGTAMRPPLFTTEMLVVFGATVTAVVDALQVLAREAGFQPVAPDLVLVADDQVPLLDGDEMRFALLPGPDWVGVFPSACDDGTVAGLLSARLGRPVLHLWLEAGEVFGGSLFRAGQEVVAFASDQPGPLPVGALTALVPAADPASVDRPDLAAADRLVGLLEGLGLGALATTYAALVQAEDGAVVHLAFLRDPLWP